MQLLSYLDKDLIFSADSIDDTETFYHKFSIFLKKQGVIRNSNLVKRLFIKRENIQSTGIGKGAAAPHIFSDQFSRFIISLAIIKDGIDFNAPDGKRIQLIFLIMSDQRDVGLHLKSLAHIARLVSSTDIVEQTVQANDIDEIMDIVAEKEAQV